MKTMENFDGSKGDFKYGYPFVDSDQLFIKCDSGFVAEVKAPDTWMKVESEANAKLFVNSKKVLEAAIEVLRFKDSISYMASEQMVTPDNLLKSFVNLEQAINDSL